MEMFQFQSASSAYVSSVSSYQQHSNPDHSEHRVIPAQALDSRLRGNDGGASADRNRNRKHQHGEVLLYVLFALLVILLGALYAMRGLIGDTVVAGNAAQHQKNVQMGDAALALANRVIKTQLGSNYGSIALSIAAQGQKWFYVPPGPGAWDTPGVTGQCPNADPSTGNHDCTNAGYWTACSADSATMPCVDLSDNANTPGGAALPGGYTARMVVVPTNLPVDANVCGTTGYNASYYNIFLSVTEPNGNTSAQMESVYRQCVFEP